jgi:hypothetical protein
LVYFVVFWYILWSFGIPILWHLGRFFSFGYVAPRKIWQPCVSPWQKQRVGGARTLLKNGELKESTGSEKACLKISETRRF